MFKIDLLKKSYPNAMIPEFSIHSDYNTMKKTKGCHEKKWRQGFIKNLNT